LNDFLSHEKLEAGRVEPSLTTFDLVKLAEEITEEMQLIAKKDQNIIYQHTGSNSRVNLDLNLLKNCIINLIANAIKYSGENTFIEFNTEIGKNGCIITIKDNGIGIPETDQKHLFEAFFRAHNTGNIPGTGLGLNIVARYARLMNGSVAFKSSVNKGTIFTISFPEQ
jgi:signal transduction histidine kinase